jgi:S-adenosylmethionine:tRNA ribosyltransferase-isomerase
MSYSLEDFQIKVPEELIAQYPSPRRGGSRLLVLKKEENELQDDFFSNIARYINSDDCLIYNDARVINARLHGVKMNTGAKLEVLLIRKWNETDWVCIIRPARRVHLGSTVRINPQLTLEVIAKPGNGMFRVRFSAKVDFEDLKEIGEIPLPKYIKRKPRRDLDDLRYQTIFSKKYGAVASPTAGLHFTDRIVKGIKQKGAVLVPVTLYVEWGTFMPVRESDYRNHKIHSELYEITEGAAQVINRCVEAKRRIVCVGTTSVRTVESAAGADGKVKSGRGETNLYIYPGYKFKTVNVMITNFHMPDSTLLLLVAAFSGKELIEKAYRHAVSQKYRFYSYGDAMLIG